MAKDVGNETTVGNTAAVEKPGFGARHLQLFIMNLCMIVMFIVRSSMGVAILAMAEKPTNGTDIPVYEWDKKKQDVILSSFFWGYMMSQIPAGVLAKRLGAKMLLGVGISLNTLFCFFIPLSASYGWLAVCILRMSTGLVQGCLFPCMHTLMGKWVPVEERSRFGTIVICGSQIGTVISMPLSGYLASTSYGWPLIFKVLAAISLLVNILWFTIAADTPAQSLFIKSKERIYIENSLQSNTTPTMRMKIPWKKIFTSKPVYAFIIAHAGVNWVFVMFFVEMPSFMKHVLGADGRLAGVLSSLPFVTMAVMGITFSFVCDHLYNRGTFNLTKLRKSFQTIAAVGTSVTLILMSFIPKEHMALSVFVLTCSLGCFSAIKSGSELNNVDMAPNFAGVIFAIGNCASNALAIAAPITAGLITAADPSDPKRWAIVFFIAAAIMLISDLVFVKFGSSKMQPWNDVETSPELEVNKELHNLLNLNTNQTPAEDSFIKNDTKSS